MIATIAFWQNFATLAAIAVLCIVVANYLEG
jgi:hypothetical protein